MKKEIHPAYQSIKVICSCGNTFSTGSTLGQELHLEICSACHPFYTGQQKSSDTSAPLVRFREKYKKFAKQPAANTPSAGEPTEPEKK